MTVHQYFSRIGKIYAYVNAHEAHNLEIVPSQGTPATIYQKTIGDD